MEKKEESWGREGIKGYVFNVSDRRRRERKKNNSTNIGVLPSLGENYLFVLLE